MKAAYILPIVNKADIDPSDIKSYQTISNLSVVIKLLERLVCNQLMINSWGRDGNIKKILIVNF